MCWRVSNGFVEVQDRRDACLMAPIDEVMEKGENAFTIDARRLFKHQLVEAKADVVEPERCDVLDVIPRDIGVKVLEVANCQYHAPFWRQEFEALVVGEPATNAHAFVKRVVFHVCFFP